jgi:ubiquinone/menaquinone biosynthesis C-methylase UbiE
MGLWETHFLPRVINVLCGNAEIRQHRAQVVEGLNGVVVEIGFGSGLNVPLYPPAVSRVLAVEPSQVGRKLSAKRCAASSVPVEFVGLDGEQLPLEDQCADAALSTFTLCTIPDAVQALRELRRVLRPGGTVHFAEHGRADDPVVARKQDRLNGFEKRVAGGCNLNRQIDQLFVDAGFELTNLTTEWMRGPEFIKPWNYLYKGVATKVA